MTIPPKRTSAILDYQCVDPEARLGLPSGRYTTPHMLTAFAGGIFLMVILYSVGLMVREKGPWFEYAWKLLAGYQGMPFVMMVLSCWSASFLILKSLKITAQRKALRLELLPKDPGFVITAATSIKVIQMIEASVEQARRFLYLNRIIISLRSMRNVGRVADVDDMLYVAASNDQSILESGYTLLKGFIWAIPVLGFIGTVIGLTQAMGNFNLALAPVASGTGNQDVQSISKALVQVLSGLDTAFVTTAEALILVFVIHLAHVFVRNADEALLDDAREEAHNQIGARVRIEPTGVV